MTLIGFGLIALLVASFACLYRIGAGPTPPDRSDVLRVLCPTCRRVVILTEVWG